MIVNRDSNDIGFMDIKTKKMIGTGVPWQQCQSAYGHDVARRTLCGHGRHAREQGVHHRNRTLKLVKEIPVDIAPEHLSFSPDSRWYYQGNPEGTRSP